MSWLLLYVIIGVVAWVASAISLRAEFSSTETGDAAIVGVIVALGWPLFALFFICWLIAYVVREVTDGPS